MCDEMLHVIFKQILEDLAVLKDRSVELFSDFSHWFNNTKDYVEGRYATVI